MVQPAVNTQGQQFVAQGNPPYTEATRQGGAWNVSLASAIAPLNAIPTTVAALEIFNNQLGGSGNCLVIDSLFAFELVGTAFVRSAAIYAMVTTVKAAPANNALSIFSHSGRATYTTTAASRIITALGSTVVANGWRPWGPVQMFGGAVEVATPGESMEAPVQGKMVVPPQCSLCLHVTSSLATGTYTMGASWYELNLPNIVI